MSKPAIQKPAQLGGHHVAAQLQQGASVLALALCNAQDGGEVAFGDGLELATTRAGDQVSVPDWVQIFPAGPEIVARDGRTWTLPEPQALVEAFLRNQADLPFDLEHATEVKAPKGEPAPAQGWVKELQVRADRTVWVRVDWNEAGRAAIASKSYRYVSPAFRFTKEGREIVAVTSVALTTQPALTIPALARTKGGNPEQQETMTKLTLVALASAAGLEASATEDAVLSAIAANAQAAKDIKDPTKFVPKTDLDAALARATSAEGKLQTIEEAAAEQKAAGLIDQAIEDGKIPPASKEHWLGLARDNFETAEKALASMPKVLEVTKKARKVEGDGAVDENGLTDEQKAICRTLGVEEKDFAANLKEQA
ncbi:phage protease [Phenylobacterium sp.]|uniref:phage protease n=1 Tax=Phenylobacterium sp. TaxID=1871053 RepID=UPI003919D864